MSAWAYVSLLLWLLGAAGMYIELADEGQRPAAAVFGAFWPLVMVWALARWAVGK